MRRFRCKTSVPSSGSPGARSTSPSATNRELFTTLLQYYGPVRAPGVRELRDATSPRAALERVFGPGSGDGAAPRCLVLDTIVKMPDSSPEIARLVEAAARDLQESFGVAIERGQAAGEIARGVDPAQAAAALIGLYLGRYVLIHSGAARESVLAAVARQAQALVPPRAKQFSVEDVLAKAVRRFSTHGYHATSVKDLEQCMGIHRGSIYDTFGSKCGLFVSALRSHIERYEASLRKIVDQSAAPAAAIRNVFARAANDGGLILKAAVELAAHDDEIGRIVTDVWCEVETLFGTLIEEGQGAGEIAEHVDPASTARALLGMSLGSGVIGEPLLQQAQTLVPATA